MDQKLISELEEMTVELLKKEDVSKEDVESFFKKCVEGNEKDLETRKHIALFMGVNMYNKGFMKIAVSNEYWRQWADKTIDLRRSGQEDFIDSKEFTIEKRALFDKMKLGVESNESTINQ